MSASKNAGAAPAESLTRNVQDGLATAMEIPKKIMEANLDTGAELLTFMSRWMKAQADLCNGVGHCHDLTEAADMQRMFWDKVTKDYSEEMNHLAEIARKNFEAMSGLMTPKTNGGGNQRRAM
jgi:Phasin protein